MSVMILAAATVVASVACGTVRGADDREHCRAVKNGDSSICYSITDNDQRTACRAEVRRDPSICYGVIDPAIREACRVRAGKM